MGERRVYPRTECNQLVYLKFVDSEGRLDRQVLGHILDISKGGVRIHSPIPIETKRIIMSTLDQNNKSIGVGGNIVHSAKFESGGYVLGVKFIAPESSCLKFIKAVIRTYYIQAYAQVTH